MQPEARKAPVNSTQEYYHPTKDEPQRASLAQVMRAMLGLRLRSGSGPAPALVRSGPGGRKSEVTQALREGFQAQVLSGGPPFMRGPGGLASFPGQEEEAM